ncbi:SNF2-related protein [Pseudosulfitobacter sp. SM2401]|uniref:DEAD/DEAH box helicase n=1 Tax=Pseudosulfitobacter sp. SM2401 TaxID=3350098 RepID=UPI0036F40224
MSENTPHASFGEDAVEIRFPEGKHGIIRRLISSNDRRSFTELGKNDRDLLFAIADLRNWQDQHPQDVEITDDHLRLSHDAAASLSAAAAEAIGLPPTVEFTLKTDVTGVLGGQDFKLHYEWMRHGQRETAKRMGSVLTTSKGKRRVPLWMKRALDIADDFDASQPMETHWRALAQFRHALEPEDMVPETMPENREMAGLSMTAFLRGLEVRIADRFSISPDRTLGEFEVVPYSAEQLASKGLGEDDISESDSELDGEALAVFQHKLRSRGPRPAYQLGSNAYLVIDRGAAPILEEMARVQRASREERRTFVENPRAYITEAVNRHLSEQGAFEGLDAIGQEELVESVAGPALIESREYSDRVTGTTIYKKPPTDFESSGTAWLPEVFDAAVTETIRNMPVQALRDLHAHMTDVLEKNSDAPAQIEEHTIAVTHGRLAALAGELDRRDREEMGGDESTEKTADDTIGPIILDTLDNFEELSWHAELEPRTPTLPFVLPETITTTLRNHQTEGFDWATRAWQSGLPGILNADEQGLGKTLQTLSFLAWLKEHMKSSDAAIRGPILIVAPTSLLRNWEQEVETHVAARGFGTLIRLYGSSISTQKKNGSQGTETNTGLPLLDFDWLDEAFEDGRAHRYWILTTYTTLANYQHSLGRIRFSALVMDEIQNIKNRSTLASKAAEAMNADFRLGLTGTPIENSAMDLWTIMDRIAPGSLGAGTDFKKQYTPPDADNMLELHRRVFEPQENHPPLGLRRLKDEVARELPSKSRFLHPRLMPQVQALAYDQAQQKLSAGGPGAALRMLHHIRSVSVHPGPSEVKIPDEFVAMSARLDATMEILHNIRSRKERVLVFIEHREMQFRFAEIVRHFLGLERIDVINGDTPISRRQEIVNRFQRHLSQDDGFDMLILGPKSAGTGLTLTAATHVIHLSRWWNPAVEEQCNDRVHRIGQTKPVQVHVPMAIHPGLGAQSFDCLLQSLMQRKRRLAAQALWPMGDTKADLSILLDGLTQNPPAGTHTSLNDCMAELYRRDGLASTEANADKAWPMP